MTVVLKAYMTLPRQFFQCGFSNKYLEKKAQLIRIPDTAKPEVKEKLKKYTL